MMKEKRTGKQKGAAPALCGEKSAEYGGQCRYCYTPIETCIHARRCFITGEYCSKQTNIQYEREKIHKSEKIKIRAFVVMNFSDMSNVVYKWRLKSFIESLAAYLYIDERNNRLYCCPTEDDGGLPWKKVDEIEVIRSDTAPASNYVVCNRICQQMQIADLIVVDVSSQNANVFYEFGMAVALGKLILPICYSESFYKMVYPEKWKQKYVDLTEAERKKIEHHIGFFPWRKALFEYYGIRYKNENSKTKYADFSEVIKPEYGFDDLKYDRFPYHEVILPEQGGPVQSGAAPGGGKSKKKGKGSIGEKIYDQLSDNYNKAEERDNTLVVYTMDAFLNRKQAGSCIVNFYHDITSRMNQEKCFRGERVGVLVQENSIPENEKDAAEQTDLFYNIGEIIQIGTNQATYLAAEEKIKADDDFTRLERSAGGGISEFEKLQRKDIERFVKEHITNRAMRIYPNNPVFVDRMRNLLHKDILKSGGPVAEQECGCYDLKSFCLYHVMLRTLRYTNEIVVDISNNDLQSLFWLGAAHGSDIHAITVSHEKTETEKARDLNGAGKDNRNIFDVAGLWMAILRKDDIEGFYQQLALAQIGIERHSKLLLTNSDFYKTAAQEYMFPFDVAMRDKDGQNDPKRLYEQKLLEEMNTMGTYYRTCFWNPMLSYNKLCIYLSQTNERGENNREPRLYMSKWDYDAAAVFTNYLSKRKIIGEYCLISLPEGKHITDPRQDPAKMNFICVGSRVQPLEESLPDYISKKIARSSFTAEGIAGVNEVHRRWDAGVHGVSGKECEKEIRSFKGFERVGGSGEGFLTQQPQVNACTGCPRLTRNQNREDNETDGIGIAASYCEAERMSCRLKKNGEHYEIAQLILWRDDSENMSGENYFRIGIMGCSGPATYALSTLFVSGRHYGGDENLLYDLQKTARGKFMEVFLKKLRKELEKIPMEFRDRNGQPAESCGECQKEKYFALVEHAVCAYLNTVLYRYFFPCLSEKDVDRICNGMYTFVNSMKAAAVSPFALNYNTKKDKEYSSVVSNETITSIVVRIPEVLGSVIKCFKGLEAFYQVTVKHCLEESGTWEDTRQIIHIEPMRDKRFSSVNCFFTE